ncbi:hypothetical protein Rhopal_006501-T1 [Rhodotorula paludigena]|uniref:MT-A70-domain-containing protein n=1 Tax=Rhodotorula paludigena TaxID=86838 RepID=A0AAV5GU59_9BASI|nr:hypothetical protein Rhopal_006501-T1 [Rhodotorula paludigena]
MGPSSGPPVPLPAPAPPAPSPAASPALPRPPPILRAPPASHSTRPPRHYTPPSLSAGQGLAGLPPRPGPVVRPPPARQGQPASQRNFDKSSAGGASSHLGGAQADGKARGREGSEERGLSEAQRRKCARWGAAYVPAEETIRNDYSGQYVQTGQRPQNHLRNTAVETRFAEYPKLATLLTHKHALTASPHLSIPPTYLNLPALPADTDPSTTSPMSAALSLLHPSRFDCILLTPPPSVTFSELAALDLGQRAATPGFVWLWVGSGQTGLGGVDGGGIGLEKGRELLSLWGYRRCEDIVWLKTNKADPEGELVKEPVSLFNPTLEHCLMGIRGTVRRSTDSFLVHCNVDTDVIVWEGDSADPALKPPELQSLIENFCLGTRRLHLYGSPHALRRGWLTVSASPGVETYSRASHVAPVEREGDDGEQRERWGEPRAWKREEWEARWKRPGMVAAQQQQEGEVKVESLLPFVEELDNLRPKSPPPRNGLPSSGGLGRGRGAGLGITRSGLVGGPQVGAAGPAGAPNGVNGLGRGRGRGRGWSDGQALVPPPPPPPLGMPYPVPAGAAPPFPIPPHPHLSASAPPFQAPPPVHYPAPAAPQGFYPPSASFPHTAYPAPFPPYGGPAPPHQAPFLSPSPALLHQPNPSHPLTPSAPPLAPASSAEQHYAAAAAAQQLQLQLQQQAQQLQQLQQQVAMHQQHHQQHQHHPQQQQAMMLEQQMQGLRLAPPLPPQQQAPSLRSVPSSEFGGSVDARGPRSGELVYPIGGPGSGASSGGSRSRTTTGELEAFEDAPGV